MAIKPDRTEIAKRLAYWRKNFRWGKHGNKPKIGPDGLSLSALLNTPELSRWKKSKWMKCISCKRIVIRNKKRECGPCNAARSAKYYLENREKELKRHKIFRDRQDQKIKRKKYFRSIYLKRKADGKHLEHKYKRRALIRGLPFGDSISRPKSAKCFWCGKKIKGSDIHMDHVVPLSRGGENTFINVVASCKHCNLSKGAKMPNDWAKQGVLCLTS